MKTHKFALLGLAEFGSLRGLREFAAAARERKIPGDADGIYHVWVDADGQKLIERSSELEKSPETPPEGAFALLYSCAIYAGPFPVDAFPLLAIASGAALEALVRSWNATEGSGAIQQA